MLWSWGLLCAATVGAALLFGGLHTPTLLAAALLVFASAGLSLGRRSLREVPLPAWLLFGLAAYTLLQAMPLPAGAVHFLSPATAEVWQRAFDVATPSQGWMSLSMDRGATLLEALKWAMYGAAFIAAASFGAAASMARGLLLPLGSALLIAVVTLAHGLSGARAVFGLYEPTFSPSIWHIGPLLNPNHLASYLNLGVFCGLGLLIARRAFLPRWVLGLAVAFLIPNAIVAGSRGGIIGLAVGVALFFLALPKRQAADPDFGPVPKLALTASLATVFVMAAGLTALLASEVTSRELYATNFDKLRLLRWAWQLIGDHAWFGVGRGAFESVFPAYRNGVNNEIYTHPENLLAQWLGEWGIPVGALAIIAFGWILRPRRLGARWSAVASGAVAGVGAVLAQNLADFGLEVPAVALSVVVALGVCWGHANLRRREAQRAEPVGKPRAALLLSGMGIALCLFVYRYGAQPVALERLALAEMYRAHKATDDQSAVELRRLTAEAVLAHPGDPYFYRLGALLAWRAHEDPMPWLQRALERGPSLGRTHLLVARVLSSRRAIKQALLELRLATTFDPALAPITAKAAASWTQDFDMLMRAVPSGVEGVRSLLAMARELPLDGEVRSRVLQEAVARDPGRKDTSRLLAQEAVRQLELGMQNQRCQGQARAGCVLEAERWLTTMEAGSPGEVDALLLRTRVLRSIGEDEKAVELLTQRCVNLAARARSLCLKNRMDLAAKSESHAMFAAAKRDYLADNCTDAENCSVALERVGDMSVARGDHDGALQLYDRALRERSDDRLWMKVARASIRVGAYQRALTALGRIRDRKRFEAEYSRLEKAAQRSDLVGK